MELVLGRTGELQPGPYVDCPKEGCAYTLTDGVLMRHDRDAQLVLREKAYVVDPDRDVFAQDHSRLRRIERVLAESATTTRLMSPYVVFVPHESASTRVRAGSGIVGSPTPGAKRIIVYYEGAIYGQSGMPRFADRVFHAHGRLTESYPTVAMGEMPAESLVDVGVFDPGSGEVVLTDRESEVLLASWLNTEVLNAVELRRSGGPRWN